MSQKGAGGDGKESERRGDQARPKDGRKVL